MYSGMSLAALVHITIFETHMRQQMKIELIWWNQIAIRHKLWQLRSTLMEMHISSYKP